MEGVYWSFFPEVTHSHWAQLSNDQSLQFSHFLVIC